jgi:solute carrier family 25 carnitine/acylcarnitine transporter 20/29
MLSPLSGIALVNAIIFGSYSQAKGRFEQRHVKDGTSKNLKYGLLPYHEIAIAGACAGFANSFVSGPVELMKTQMQVQYRNPDTSKHYKGSFDAAKKIIKTAGLGKVFMGLPATMIREIPGTAGYYAAYEFSRRMIAGDDDPKNLPVHLLLLSGALGGIGYWLCCYPFDLIKSRIQAQSVHAPPTYRSWLHCARTMIATEGGYRALFRGFDAAIIRTIPASGATFVAFELSLAYFNRHGTGTY